MKELKIAGGGLAGCAAALAALQESHAVRILEQSRHPRHKVCGEFLSPEAGRLIQQLGAWDRFQRCQPATIRRCILYFGRRTKSWTLPEPAFGISRQELDQLLLGHAVAQGAVVTYERYAIPDGGALSKDSPTVIAAGRRCAARRGNRLFGFKAHYEGPVDDAVELFFFGGAYAGVSSVEQGTTNVCGIAPESALRACGFDPDVLLSACQPLAERLRPLRRKFAWLRAGPLTFSRRFHAPGPYLYPAGDALGFVDPFTGSGMLNALATGSLAGRSAARGVPAERYVEQCQELLRRPYLTSAIIRAALASGAGQHIAQWIPGRMLFRLTRARPYPGNNTR